MDTIDMWPYLSGKVERSPRSEVHISAQTFVSGQYKYIAKDVTTACWGGPLYPNASTAAGPHSGRFGTPCSTTIPCEAHGGCLYVTAPRCTLRCILVDAISTRALLWSTHLLAYYVVFRYLHANHYNQQPAALFSQRGCTCKTAITLTFISESLVCVHVCVHTCVCFAACRFDVEADISEYNNLAADPNNSALVKSLSNKLVAANQKRFSPNRGTFNKLACEAAERYGGYWGPFLP